MVASRLKSGNCRFKDDTGSKGWVLKIGPGPEAFNDSHELLLLNQPEALAGI